MAHGQAEDGESLYQVKWYGWGTPSARTHRKVCILYPGRLLYVTVGGNESLSRATSMTLKWDNIPKYGFQPIAEATYQVTKHK